MGEVLIYQSKKLEAYKPILEGLVDDFGYTFYHAILVWCGIIEDKIHDERFWEVYLISGLDDETIGMCGLYSLRRDSLDELWLGWFGILPEHRNRGIGEDVLGWMKRKAKRVGAKKLMSYVDSKGKPLNFYYRNGFKNIGTVKDYLIKNPDLHIEEFEDGLDHVIEYEINSIQKCRCGKNDPCEKHRQNV